MSTTNASLSSSLSWPPIYRRFLAGGEEQLRLARNSLALLLAYGAILWLATPLVCSARTASARPLWLWLVAVATLQAALVAALAARWLGNRAGLLAGLLQLTAGCLLPGAAALCDALFCLAFSIAMGAFMVAQVPGRVALAEGPALRWIFFLTAAIAGVVGGPASLTLLVAVCVCQWIAGQDRRGLRYFRDPIGLGIFGLVTVTWLVTAGWAGRPGTGLVDWGFSAGPGCGTAATWGTAAMRLALFVPLALPAMWSGLRNGHYAIPFWRFLVCWSLGPLVLLPLGHFRVDVHFGALLPPLAITAAVGLENLLRRVRRDLRR